MIQVLHKAFDILEILAKTPDRSWTSGEIANQLGLNPGTCANILKTMAKRDYVFQETPRKGYQLGLMAQYISRGHEFSQALTGLADPFLEGLSKELGETTLLSVLRQNRKYVLCQKSGGGNVQVSSELLFLDSVYQTATGRLLLAHLTPEKIAAFVKENGLPDERWPEIKNAEGLEAALESISENGNVVFNSKSEVVFVAFPIRHSETVVAALGISVPEYRFSDELHAKIMDLGLKCSKSISEALNKITENK